jgi:cell cycle sensor histidine kinase DivJ
LQNRGLFDRIHIADRPAYLRALSEAATSGDTCEVEFRLRREAKAEFTWIEMRCWSSDGNPDCSGDTASPEVVAVMRDITSRKTRQDALLEARAEAERANAAKSRFLACMSHELRTPLTAIIGFSDLLRNPSENLIDTTRTPEYARIINESGHHLLAVANEILDMSRLETGNFGLFPEPLRVDAVIASCTELLALRVQEAGVVVNIAVPADLPEIVADRRAVMQILINLVTNAIKFSDPGGTVYVSAGVDGEHICLEVADTGIGIAPHDLTRIGNPFFQVQGRYGRKHDGAGLGLSIVKALVNLHGGELKAESRPGEGTRMAVRLPLDYACVATSWRPVPIANVIRDDIPNALSERSATSGHVADPSVFQPGGMNSPASFSLPVQRRA